MLTATFLADYLEGADTATEYLEDHSTEQFVIPASAFSTVGGPHRGHLPNPFISDARLGEELLLCQHSFHGIGPTGCMVDPTASRRWVVQVIVSAALIVQAGCLEWWGDDEEEPDRSDGDGAEGTDKEEPMESQDILSGSLVKDGDGYLEISRASIRTVDFETFDQERYDSDEGNVTIKVTDQDGAVLASTKRSDTSQIAGGEPITWGTTFTIQLPRNVVWMSVKRNGEHLKRIVHVVTLEYAIDVVDPEAVKESTPTSWQNQLLEKVAALGRDLEATDYEAATYRLDQEIVPAVTDWLQDTDSPVANPRNDRSDVLDLIDNLYERIEHLSSR